MIQQPFYVCSVTINQDGTHTIQNNFAFWENLFDTGKLIECDVTKALIQGGSFNLTYNEIDVSITQSQNTPRIKEIFKLAKQVLQDDFKMDCDDEFGLHHTVVSDSIKIYPNENRHFFKYLFKIRFNVIIKLAICNTGEIVEEINRNGFVEIQPSLFKHFIGALKLAHDDSSSYKISKMERAFWIHKNNFEPQKLWDYFAPQIWNSTSEADAPLRLIQLTCPDKELRDRLKKITSTNGRMIMDYQSNLEVHSTHINALQKLFELKKDKSFPSDMDLQKRVGLYIIRLIRQNPEKYLDSDYPVIKKIANELHQASPQSSNGF